MSTFPHLAPALMALASPTAIASAPPPSVVAYDARPVMAGAAVQALEVTVVFSATPGGTTGFGWDAQWAGETRLWQWARDVHISGATAVGEDRPGHWSISAPGGTPITVTYRIVSAVDADPMLRTFEQAWPIIRPRWFFAMGSAVFGRPDDRGGSTATFHWSGPSTLPFASDLQHLDVARGPSGHGTVDDVLESVLIGGEDVRVEGDASSVRVATIGSSDEASRLAALARRVIAAERHFWRAPNLPYLVAAAPLAVEPGQSGFAGTNRGDGFALWLAPGTGDDDLALLLSHEYFHTWNPDRLGGSDGDARLPGSSYWFSEGLTDFYARELMLRAGVLSRSAYMRSWNDMLLAYAVSPVRTMPGAEAGRRFFERDDIQKLAYQRGSLLAALWNARLLARSHGRVSLDMLLREQAQMAPQSKRSAVALFRTIAQRHGLDVDADIAQHIDAGTPITLPPGTFGRCIAVETAARHVFDRGYDAAATSDAMNVVVGVDPASSAHAAGLRDGMRILERKSGRVGDADQPFVLDVEDHGTRRTISYLPQSRGLVPVTTLRPAQVLPPGCGANVAHRRKSTFGATG